MRFPVLLAVLAASACAQTPADDTADRRRADTTVTAVAIEDHSLDARPSTRLDSVVVPVGDLDVTVRRHTVDGPGRPADALWAVNLHDDESTSVEAALAVIAETGGTVVELVHTGDRNLAFTVESRAYPADGGPHRTHRGVYGADPNRMFTAAGLARTLEALSEPPVFSDGGRAVARLAEHVLTETGLGDAAVVVTLHNNTDDNYSAASYRPGAVYATDAAAVTIHPGSDADDFFFVTDRPLYDALVARGFNAVLQDNAAATDDGSLSVWAAQNGRPYVNVEAQHGHRDEQVEMIRALVEVLAER